MMRPNNYDVHKADRGTYTLGDDLFNEHAVGDPEQSKRDGTLYERPLWVISRHELWADHEEAVEAGLPEPCRMPKRYLAPALYHHAMVKVPKE